MPLAYNNIGDKGAAALAQNSSITDLNLGNNKIGDAGAAALAKNSSITTVCLGSNNIGDETLKFVKGAIAQNVELYKQFMQNINQIQNWNIELLEYLIKYINIPESCFKDSNELYKTADKIKIDQVADKLLKAKHLCKTEEGRYSISIVNEDNLSNMYNSLYILMNQYLDHKPAHHTREQISAAIEGGVKSSIIEY